MDSRAKTWILHTPYDTQGVCKIQVLVLEHAQSSKILGNDWIIKFWRKKLESSPSILEDWGDSGAQNWILHTPLGTQGVCKIDVLVLEHAQSSKILGNG